ncbi:MAG: pirin family protein, partial [Candidatus Acidiferrales bacterium]
YYDPKNMQWGALRVFNDDVIQPGQGFGMHPHRDMEIVTYVLEGALEHRDSLGNTGVIRPGEVQVMRAGTGIVHSEYNHSKKEPLRLLQLWILPRTKGLAPRWEQQRFSPADRAGKLLPVVSPGSGNGKRDGSAAIPGTMQIDQDATIYLSALAAGQQAAHASAAGRKAYLFVTDGQIEVNGSTVAAGDQARIANEPKLAITAQKGAEFILLDLPS